MTIELKRYSLVRLYFLILTTVGFYALFWIYHHAKALYTAEKINTRPWVLVLFSLIPIVDLIVFAVLYRRIYQTLALERRFELFILIVVTFISADIGLVYDANVVLILSVLTFPLALIRVQAQINKHYCQQQGIGIETLHYTAKQMYTVSFGSLFVVFLVLLITEPQRQADLQSKYPGGEYHKPGDEIISDKKLYKITIPDGSWKRLKQGTLHESTDIELYDKESGLEAWTYVVTGDDAKLDNYLLWRKQSMRKNSELVFVDEQRTILDQQAMTVTSLAHYIYKDDEKKKNRYVIRTLEVQGHKELIEILISYPRDKDKQKAIMLANMLELNSLEKE